MGLLLFIAKGNEIPMHMFLDDERFPVGPGPWAIVRSFDEAVLYVKQNGIPEFISFDHDIASEPETGYTFAKWLVEQDIDGNYKFPDNFSFYVHSANPVGAKNINMYLAQYLGLIK